jgi:hypothetical protein
LLSEKTIIDQMVRNTKTLHLNQEHMDEVTPFYIGFSLRDKQMPNNIVRHVTIASISLTHVTILLRLINKLLD